MPTVTLSNSTQQLVMRDQIGVGDAPHNGVFGQSPVSGRRVTMRHLASRLMP